MAIRQGMLKYFDNQNLGNYWGVAKGITISGFSFILSSPLFFHPTLVPFFPYVIYMLFGVNYHSPHELFKNQTRFFEGKDVCYLSRIRFTNRVRRESELFNLFLSTKVPNSKK